MATTEKLTSNIDELRTLPMGEIPSVAGWKEVPIHETEKSHEPLVPLGIFSDHRKVFTSSVYADEHENSPYTDGLEGSLMALFVRKGVAEKLDKAAELLPSGYHLMAMDTYRTIEVQRALFKQYESGLRTTHPDWSDDEIMTETQKYVSLPSTDPSRPSPHNTGASVDVVIMKVPDEVQEQIDDIDRHLENAHDWREEYLLEMLRSELLRKNGEMLDFGTPFDHGDAEASLDYFERKDAEGELDPSDWEAASNRRLLFHVMTRAGFEPYAEEWWHYNDPASQMGAKTAGAEYAEYGAAVLSEENKYFADVRKLHAINTARHARGEQWDPPEDLIEHYGIAREASRGNDPDAFPKLQNTVSKIAPTKAA